MGDEKPPRLVGDERATLHELLQYQRESLVRKVTGLDDGQARRALVESGTTLLWLVKHVARAERVWVLHRFAGEDDVVYDGVGRDDRLADAVEFYRSTWARVDEVVASTASLDEPCARPGPEGQVTLRWVLMHLLEETARHAGHADILRELIDGETGR